MACMLTQAGCYLSYNSFPGVVEGEHHFLFDCQRTALFVLGLMLSFGDLPPQFLLSLLCMTLEMLLGF